VFCDTETILTHAIEKDFLPSGSGEFKPSSSERGFESFRGNEVDNSEENFQGPELLDVIIERR
jgi:hypothetical protein